MATRPLIFQQGNPASRAKFEMPLVSDIRDQAKEHNQWMKDLVPKGSYTTPKVPFARSIDSAFTADPAAKTGRFAPGNGGSVVWQRGTGPGATAPPQTSSQPASMQSLESAFGANSLTNRASASDGAVRTGPISSRKAVPVGGGGRSATDKLGMLARRAWTRQDEKGYTDLIQAQAGLEQRGIDRAFSADQADRQRGFYDAQNDKNFAQSKEMRGIDAAYRESDYQRNKQDALDAEVRGNARSDLEWNRNRGAQLEDERNRGIDAPFEMQFSDGSKLPMVRDKGGNLHQTGGGMIRPPGVPPPKPNDIWAHMQEAGKAGFDASWHGPEKGFSYAPRAAQKPQDGGSESTVEEQDANGNWAPRTRTTTKRLGMPDQGSLTGRKGGGYW